MRPVPFLPFHMGRREKYCSMPYATPFSSPEIEIVGVMLGDSQYSILFYDICMVASRLHSFLMTHNGTIQRGLSHTDNCVDFHTKIIYSRMFQCPISTERENRNILVQHPTPSCLSSSDFSALCSILLTPCPTMFLPLLKLQF